MITIDILRCSNGKYVVTVDGKIVVAGLTNGAARQEAERLVESGEAEDARVPPLSARTPHLGPLEA